MAERDALAAQQELGEFFSATPLDLSQPYLTPELLAKWEHEVAELRQCAAKPGLSGSAS